MWETEERLWLQEPLWRLLVLLLVLHRLEALQGLMEALEALLEAILVEAVTFLLQIRRIIQKIGAVRVRVSA
jgi:hypothetical protein